MMIWWKHCRLLCIVGYCYGLVNSSFVDTSTQNTSLSDTALNELFLHYGQNGSMTFQGFELLLKSLGLVKGQQDSTDSVDSIPNSAHISQPTTVPDNVQRRRSPLKVNGDHDGVARSKHDLDRVFFNFYKLLHINFKY